MGGESREFLLEPITQQLNCKLFAFKMSDIRNHYSTIRIKKLMILEIGRNKNISTSSYRVGQQKAAAPTAYRNTPYLLGYQCCMPHDRGFHS